MYRESYPFLKMSGGRYYVYFIETVSLVVKYSFSTKSGAIFSTKPAHRLSVEVSGEMGPLSPTAGKYANQEVSGEMPPNAHPLSLLRQGTNYAKKIRPFVVSIM